MNAIRFNTIVGDDQVIRPPAGILLPTGSLEVTVIPSAISSADQKAVADLRRLLLEAAAQAKSDPTPLPEDLAENHDYYVHGKPRE